MYFTQAYLFMPKGHSFLSKTVFNRISWILDGHLGNFHLLLHYSVFKFLYCIYEVQTQKQEETREAFKTGCIFTKKRQSNVRLPLRPELLSKSMQGVSFHSSTSNFSTFILKLKCEICTGLRYNSSLLYSVLQ